MKITTSKFKSALLKSGSRILKVLQFGAKTAHECAPFGLDSVPLENMIAIYSPTSENGENIIIGYVNKNQISKIGEYRTYSLNPDNGEVSFSIHLKTDGTCEIGGDSHTSVRFSPLDNGISSKDNLINAELQKISAALSAVGGVYTPGNISTDISNAESKDVKLK